MSTVAFAHTARRRSVRETGSVDANRELRRVRTSLVAGDAAAIATAVVMAVGDVDAVTLVAAPLAVVVGLAVLGTVGLWSTRVTAMRWLELSALLRALGIAAVGGLVADRVVGPLDLGRALVPSTIWLLLMVAWRTGHRSWLAHQRRSGRFTRRAILIGTDRPAVELARLLAMHPEAGVRVAGVIGSRRDARRAGLGDLWLGEQRDAADVLARTACEAVIVCSDVSPALLRTLEHDQQTRRRELSFHPGLSGVDVRRVKAFHVANEPLLSIEPGVLSTTGAALKRMVDVVVSATLLVVASPLFAVLAVLVKRQDGGPVFFRQRRVGRDDREFEMLKFRTMVIDAEARLDDLRSGNQRSGPLFKLGADPRVTRIGRILRSTSLDELPQLLNVLRGDMSLVGPRPALRREVDEFPPELRERHRVRPGITGLWQVEARDNPAFDAYQRLDLFYVRNWSVALDLVILLGTVEQLVVRPFAGRRRGEVDTATPTVTPAVTAA